MYENITYDVILNRMLARVSDRMDKREGSVIWDTHSPAAVELQILYMELDTILREAYGDTASREFLILRCRERGISPWEATKAVLKGIFTPAETDVTGQRFNAGELNYVVLERTGSGEYMVQCETPGRVGNQYSGTLVPVEYIPGLQTAELAEILIPGEDEEETEALRRRYLDSFNGSAFGGNVRDYLEKINAVPGVGGAKVERVWNGDIRPANMVPGEGVRNWYEGIRDSVEGEARDWLDSVYRAAAEKKLTVGGTVLAVILDSEYGAASETLVRNVQEILDPEQNAGEGYGLAPIGHVVKVRAVTAVAVELETRITFAPGYGWERLQKSIDAAVEAYLLELRMQWAQEGFLTVRSSRVESRILGLEGVVDVTDTRINGNKGNLVLGAYEIPVYGGAVSW